mmetsp:Transcript_127879/g.370099  ORF Transcript_127879/g.370099 Transcript_127879/m.370099 type:complete len:312 (+) Transcript_127879:75-1010(+)|eukprot:CAMPEP_0176090542 /NCGR_PEP_ID=MMETSP0120_2-20121206/45346_1 /TAXON_ID=160619 /ORGANISM="Kryptoperidinium foliaceum, Strain CCMP 1326" /LENGTH=311 /DNA_ID=CAMNT_0017424425 /DNA_START=72 /DNA_END=1007 /DNA_ORIENTATION=-
MRRMPRDRLVLALVLALVGLVATSATNAEFETDDLEEVALLQAEYTVKATGAARAKAAAEDGSVVGISKGVEPSSCAGFCEGSAHIQSSWGKDSAEDVPLRLLEPQSAASVRVKAEVPLSAEPWCLSNAVASALELMTVFVVIHGVRRWRAMSRSTSPSRRAFGSAPERLGPMCEKGRGVDDEDAWGCTQLHAAAREGSAAAVRHMLELGACVEMRDTWDETPLHFAARGGHAECCKVLVAACAEIDALNADDRTPLLLAAEAGHEATCRVLLDAGASAGGLEDKELPTLLVRMLACDMLLAAAGGMPSHD